MTDTLSVSHFDLDNLRRQPPRSMFKLFERDLLSPSHNVNEIGLVTLRLLTLSQTQPLLELIIELAEAKWPEKR